jgi:hypothetical protein
LSAATLAASLFAIVRRPASPLRSRLLFAFGGMAVLFAARTAVDAFDVPGLELLTLVLVCALPLAALLLAEGVLRRHAPWLLKTYVMLGALAMAAGLAAFGGRAPVATWWLGGFILSALSGVALLLFARDRGSLSRQENAGVTALLASGIFLIAVSATDFLPQTPVGLSGIGAAAVAFALGTNPSSAADVRGTLLNVVLLVVVAMIGALAVSHPLGLQAGGEQARMGAILLALLLAANAISGLRPSGASPAAQRLAQALADADTTSLEAFLNSLADQPLLAGLRVAEGAALAEYDAAALGMAMAARAVWTRARVAEMEGDRAREELADLMSRMDATHAVTISKAPLRIALLTLPEVGTSDDAETSLALFHKLSGVAAQQ